jgi:AraC family transcriptional regulator of adaptative response/methylated-DNA-[protein]-cysteine methyltransferase
MTTSAHALKQASNRPAQTPDGCRDYERMAGALAWLAAHFERQPSLAEAARAAGLSPFHFQRLFTRWVGLSPKQYVQYLSLGRAKRALDESSSLLDAAFEAGLSGPGRLHDLFVGIEALTPGQYKRRGEGLTIRHGAAPSPFGRCLVLGTERGICGLAFTDGDDHDTALATLTEGLERATLTHDDTYAAALSRRVFGDTAAGGEPLRVLVRGSPFQVQVWKALLAIPPGAVTSYGSLARRIGRPGAARAVGGAVGANPVAWLIPCHRVIRGSGHTGEYRWGPGRKLAMLSREHAQAHPGP